jgi:hypothetical protein
MIAGQTEQCFAEGEQVKFKEAMLKGNLHRPWRVFYVKALLVVLVLLLLSLAAPVAPGFVVAIAWALLSVVSMFGVMYQVVLRKVHRSMKFSSKGIVGSFNKGRVFSIVISYIASAICMGGLILEAPKWRLEWLIVAAMALVFPLVFKLVTRLISREYEPVFRKGAIVLGASAIVALLGLMAYAAYVYFAAVYLGTTQSYVSVLDAFLKTPDVFAGSSSALLTEAGMFSWISDSVVNCAVAQVAGFNAYAYLIIRVILALATFFGIASLLGTCLLARAELLAPFLSVDTLRSKNPYKHVSLVKRYVLAGAVLPFVLVAGFVYADSAVDNVKQAEEYSFAHRAARTVVNQSVYQIDGALYDKQKAESILDAVYQNGIQRDDSHLANTISALRDAITVWSEQASGGINGYLDWYFNIPNSNEDLDSMKDSQAEAVMRAKFASLVGGGSSNEQPGSLRQLENAIQDYLNEVKNRVSGSIVDVPEDKKWLLTIEELDANSNKVSPVLNSAQAVMSALQDADASGEQNAGKVLIETYLNNSVYSSDTFAEMAGAAQKVSDSSDDMLSSTINKTIGALFNQATKRSGYSEGLNKSLSECEQKLSNLIPNKEVN